MPNLASPVSRLRRDGQQSPCMKSFPYILTSINQHEQPTCSTSTAHLSISFPRSVSSSDVCSLRILPKITWQGTKPTVSVLALHGWCYYEQYTNVLQNQPNAMEPHRPPSPAMRRTARCALTGCSNVFCFG